MRSQVFAIICILFLKSVFAGQGTISGEAIKEKIFKCQTKFLDFINDHLPDDIHRILEKVSNNKLKDAHETVGDREQLRFLAIQHHNGLNAILVVISELEETLVKAYDEVMKAATIKRGELDVSTLIYPFEWYGHKCGFPRNVEV